MFLEVKKFSNPKESRLVNTRHIRSISEIKTSNDKVFTRIYVSDNVWIDAKESYLEIRSKLYNGGEVIK